MGDDIVNLSVENESLKNQIGDYEKKWLQELKAKLLKDIDDEKRANLIMSRMKNRWKNNKILMRVQILLYKLFTYLIIKYGNQNSMVSFLEEINNKI